MKKIIAAFDGLKYSRSTERYVLYLAKKTSTHLVGVFLDDLTYTSYNVYDAIKAEGLSDPTLIRLEKKDTATREAAAAGFKKSCEEAGIGFNLHHDRSIASHQLKHESTYAD